ncbi:MAG TPA: bifunctional DNA-formamidopyrimidine glycosylase/DNA-(apurinic or apyrimidinic site) lyase [Candidatus Acidoferrum sp.]|nr:bifunctional DNA-formamidopyrimidine glycosylase/DNA-(apurinic or apyrimidinic site) lyase [Candidatus Acidoferrum sp.]
MPELPEVETVVRGLRAIVIGKTIANVSLNAPKTSLVVSKSLRPLSFKSALIGRTIQSVSRRGKNIIIALSGNLTLWVHLKMTGQFHWLDAAVRPDKHDLVMIRFAGDSKHELRFHDYRRFGRLRIFRESELAKQKGLGDLGPEPLEISPSEFVKLCYRRSRQIKQALLDQTFIAGIGNIYADESLYAARIHPRKLTTAISRGKLIELHGHIRRLMKRAIALMGTSVDTYAGVNGEPGAFQKYLKVYGEEGNRCARCGHVIVREKIGSRSAHYCPNCQRRPK